MKKITFVDTLRLIFTGLLLGLMWRGHVWAMMLLITFATIAQELRFWVFR